MKFILLFLLVAQSIYADNYTQIAVNCGGEVEYTLEDGMVYQPDGLYSLQSGFGASRMGKKPNASLLEDFAFLGLEINTYPYHIYNSENYSPEKYIFNLENGDYALGLHFIEREYHSENKRIFSVFANDSLIVDSLDLIKSFGRGVACFSKHLVSITDNKLTLKFDEIKGKAVISGISLRRIDRDSTAPEEPKNIKFVGGLRKVFANWDYNFEQDFAGYKIYKQTKDGEEEIFSHASRFVDFNVLSDTRYTYRIATIDLWGNESKKSKEFDVRVLDFKDSKLPLISISISEDSLRILNDDIYADRTFECTVNYQGEFFADAKLRYKGQSSSKYRKKNFKIFLDNCTSDGFNNLNLTSQLISTSFLTEELIWTVKRENFDLTSQTKFVRLVLNDKDQGVYHLRQDENGSFLENNNIESANIYKSKYSNMGYLKDLEEVELNFEIEHEDINDSYSNLNNFIRFINLSNDTEFKSKIEDYIDTETYMQKKLLINYLADNDQMRHNFFLLFNWGTERWVYLPYDHNYALSSFSMPLEYHIVPTEDADGYQILINRLYKIPEYRFRMYQIMSNFILKYNSKRLTEIRDSLFNCVEYDLNLDNTNISGEETGYIYDKNCWLNQFFIDRENFAKENLSVFLPKQYTPNYEIILNEYSNQKPRYIELFNNSFVVAEIDSIVVAKSFDFNAGKKFNLNLTILTQQYFVINESINPEFFKEIDNYSDNIYLFDNYGNFIDSIAFKDDDSIYARFPNLTGEWNYSEVATPNLPNIIKFETPLVYINEFMPNNDSTIADESGKFEDWIELYNPNDFEVDLSGYYLSDELEETDKWKIPKGIVIEPKGYLLFWADKDEEEGDMHIDFKLSSDSGYVILTNPQNNYIIDSTYYIDADSDESFARNGDGNSEWIKAHVPTPNRSNIYYDAETRYLLKNVYPNPADDILNIYFVLHRNKNVKVRIADLLGKTVMNIYDEKLPAGEYTIETDLSDIAPGMYYLYFETKDYYEVKPFIVVR